MIDWNTEGPKRWSKLFQLASNGELTRQSLLQEVNSLPCGECRRHANEYIKDLPLPLDANTTIEQLSWLWAFKQDVNVRIGKVGISLQELLLNHDTNKKG